MFRTGWRCEDLCVEVGDSEKTHCTPQCQMVFISADLCAGQSPREPETVPVVGEEGN